MGGTGNSPFPRSRQRNRWLALQTGIPLLTDVNLFTRPRRFGKILNMSMLQYFFEDMYSEDGVKKDNSYLFENRKIMQAGERYPVHMGKYPVII